MNPLRFIQGRPAGVAFVTIAAAALAACGGGGGGTDPAAADAVVPKVAAMQVPANSPITGALFTTAAPDPLTACNPVNVNIYQAKLDVYLNGGPANLTGSGMLSAGLPQNKSFYVKVTAPDGTLLGTSVGNSALTLATTSDKPVSTDATGRFTTCPRLWDIVHKPDDNTQGYKTTPNHGGEYKVWISLSSDPQSNFPPEDSKTDNFKVRDDDDGGGGIQSDGAVTLRKWYDANANGLWDEPAASEILNWRVSLTGFDPAYTPWDFIGLSQTSMVAREYRPLETNWYPTGSLINGTAFPIQGSDATYLNWVDVNLASVNDTAVVAFGNVCLGAGGGKTLGFWSNKNGAALITVNGKGVTLTPGVQQMLIALNLVKGTDVTSYVYDPGSSYADLRNWLLNGNAVNMGYMLSVQMATMALNRYTGLVSGSALVYAPGLVNANFAGFITIDALIDEANASLGANPITRAGYTARAYQELIKNALDNANNNLNFVQPAACAFSFAPLPAPTAP